MRRTLGEIAFATENRTVVKQFLCFSFLMISVPSVVFIVSRGLFGLLLGRQTAVTLAAVLAIVSVNFVTFGYAWTSYKEEANDWREEETKKKADTKKEK